MNKVLRHKRCPCCGSLHTKKHGFKPRKKLNPDHHKILSPRWYCYECDKTFSNLKSIFSIA